jgi:hypothetical protein
MRFIMFTMAAVGDVQFGVAELVESRDFEIAAD